jgi:preprotein translocase subunit SecD
MKGDAVGRFATFTQQHLGMILTVTLDREVIQSATIQSTITGPGAITGQFTAAEAQRVATVLR